MIQNQPSCPTKKTTIGGQALIEGVMMKGVDVTALAVRKPDNTIYTEINENPTGKKPFYKTTPIIRGTFNFIEMMSMGYKYLMKSAEIAGFEDEEPSAFEKKLMDKFGDKFTNLMSAVVLVFGVGIAMLLFIVLPATIASFFRGFIVSQGALSAIEGITKIVIFVGYLAMVSRMDDIKRVFQYHGAEHKTISCYEAGEDLTVENVRKHKRFHPRCGTSFILIVLVISIIVFSVIPRSNLFVTILLKLLLLPLTVGIAYEIIKLAGRYDNIITRFISRPGLWLQNLTTYEPDDSQIEVAIEAMRPCIPKVEGADNW